MIFIALLLISFLIIGLMLYFEISYFNKTGSQKFGFFRFLPFEINSFKRNQSKSYLVPIVLFVGLLLSASPLLVFALDVVKNKGDITASFIFFTVYTLAIITFMFLYFIKMSNYKLHVIVVTIFSGLVLLLNTLYLFFFTSDGHSFDGEFLTQEVRIACLIIGFILLIFEFVLMFNPTYKRWLKMRTLDATTQFNRPKYCYLAMLEWGTLLNLLLTYIPLIIVYFF